jgi:hypothetical protein
MKKRYIVIGLFLLFIACQQVQEPLPTIQKPPTIEAPLPPPTPQLIEAKSSPKCDAIGDYTECVPEALVDGRVAKLQTEVRTKDPSLIKLDLTIDGREAYAISPQASEFYTPVTRNSDILMTWRFS